jgi:hypothetical protein
MLFIISALISKTFSLFKYQPLNLQIQGLNNKNLHPIALIATNETLELTPITLFITPQPYI